MKIDARLTFEKIRHDQDTNAHLVLTLTAPPIQATNKRPALCIIPVLDVSPSMEGEKLAYAKRSIEKLIDHLGPDDYCGLVKFSAAAEVVQRPAKVTADSKTALKRQLAGLRTDSATNIADAMLVGLDVGNKMDLPGAILVRVILFTDGQANRGPVTDQAGLVKLLQANLGTCTMSAFGYGRDADQNLLAELAKVGSGNYAFVQNPDDALTAFGKELGGLLSCYATNLTVNVTALADHEIVNVVSDVDSEEEKIGQGVRIKIPDILAEEVRHLVFAVKIKGQKGGGPRAVNVFDVKAGWDVLDAASHKKREAAEAKAKVQFVKEGEQQAKPDTDLDKIVSLAEVVQAQAEAEEKAKHGDYAGAVRHMTAAANAVGNRGNHGVEHLARSLSARLENHAVYTANSGYLNSVSRGATRGVGVGSYDAQAHADLGGVGVQLSTSTQTTTSNSFVQPDQGVIITGGPVVDHSVLGIPMVGGPAVDLTGGAGLSIAGSSPFGGTAWSLQASAPEPDQAAKHMVAKKPSLSKKPKRTW